MHEKYGTQKLPRLKGSRSRLFPLVDGNDLFAVAYSACKDMQTLVGSQVVISVRFLQIIDGAVGAVIVVIIPQPPGVGHGVSASPASDAGDERSRCITDR